MFIDSRTRISIPRYDIKRKNAKGYSYMYMHKGKFVYLDKNGKVIPNKELRTRL